MGVIKKNYLVKKQNILNEMRANNMSLQELRFFSIYLSKINANDINTRVVRFPLSDFQAIMELGRINIEYIKNITDSLLSKIVHVPIETGGYEAFQLFKRCRVASDQYGEWYVEIDAHDDALPLMFEFKERYFSYQLWNALKLKSSNQLRIYEILKQYEKIGFRVLEINELRHMLGIGIKDYPLYHDFKRSVLDVCQKALKEYTDICFTYEPYGKKGKGGKILNLKFTIQKNSTHSDPITLEKFITVNELVDSVDKSTEEELKPILETEFTQEQLKVLENCICNKQINMSSKKQHEYLVSKYDEMCMRNPKASRFAYLKKIIEADKIKTKIEKNKPSYDIDELDKYWDKVPTLD